MPDRRIHSLYVHVPFCAHKCEYCAFYSHLPSAHLVDRYVDALIREMEIVAPDLHPETVFFGGGTPSLLTMAQWGKIMQTMARLNLAAPAEWTVECNPATVSAEKAKFLREHGVTRISMGVQSLDENLLDKLGRVHSRDMVFRSFDILRAAGFDNINLDFMFGIPGQTLEMWQMTLHEAVNLAPEHLSCYELTYEEDTRLYVQLQAGEISVDEELVCRMFEEWIALAQSADYHQYEISNFARVERDGVDRRCQHNVNYWRGGSFYGLGPSAAGYVGGARTKNWSNTQLYCEQLEEGRRAIESVEQLSPLARAGEIAAFGLRMNAGWPLAEFKRRTGFDLDLEWRAEIERLVALDYGRFSSGRFSLTATGLRYADWVAEQFLRN